MHVLVTGGTGFIGRALCARLAGAGHRLSVLTRSRARALSALPPGTACVERLEALPEAVDACVNLAGENLGARRWTPARKRAFVDSRVETTRTLVDFFAAQPRRPQALVSGSAIGWYGARGDEPLAEHASPGAPDEFTVQLCRAWVLRDQDP